MALFISAPFLGIASVTGPSFEAIVTKMLPAEKQAKLGGYTPEHDHALSYYVCWNGMNGNTSLLDCDQELGAQWHG